MEVIELREESDLDLEAGTCLLDLETTGLRREEDRIFLVGLLAAKEGEGSDLIQVYDPSGGRDDRLQEGLLGRTRDLLRGRRILTYNGQAFDLPFLEAGLKRVGLPPLDPASSLDLYAWLRSRRRFLDEVPGRLADLEKKTGFLRTDRLSGRAVAQSAPMMAHPEVADLVLGHNRDDLVGTWHVKKLLDRMAGTLRMDLEDSLLGPCRLDLVRLEKTANRARVHFLLTPPQEMKGFKNSSFGDLAWEGDHFTMDLALTGGYVDEDPVRLAVSPIPFPDRSPYAFRPPLIAIYDKKRDYGQNLLRLAAALLKK